MRGDPVRADDVLSRTETGPAHIVTAVQTHILTSLVADRLREPDRALDALHHAVTLATAEQVRRPFLTLDLGLERRRIRPLLARLGDVHPTHLRFVRDLTTSSRQTLPMTTRRRCPNH